MAAGPWVFTNTGRTSLLNGEFDIDTDAWKMALFTSGSNLSVSSALFSGVTAEVGTVNTGYVAGGETVLLTLAGTTTVTVDVTPPDPIWTAGSAGLTARWAAIYEVGGSGKVLCFCLLESIGPADVTATSGNTLTVEINAAGVFTLSGG